MRQVHGRLRYVSSHLPKKVTLKFVFMNVRIPLPRSSFPFMNELQRVLTWRTIHVQDVRRQAYRGACVKHLRPVDTIHVPSTAITGWAYYVRSTSTEHKFEISLLSTSTSDVFPCASVVRCGTVLGRSFGWVFQKPVQCYSSRVRLLLKTFFVDQQITAPLGLPLVHLMY